MPTGLKMKKAVEAAAKFVALNGGKIRRLNLLKFLYLLDRHALQHWGSVVTGDRYVNMKNGPVLSEILDVSKERSRGTLQDAWKRRFKMKGEYEIALADKDDPLAAEEPYYLSESESEAIHLLYKKHGHRSWDEFSDWMHLNCPEWKMPNPRESSESLPLEKLLEGIGLPEEKRTSIAAAVKRSKAERSLLGC
jgi:Protein of unknown function (DUF4065)